MYKQKLVSTLKVAKHAIINMFIGWILSQKNRHYLHNLYRMFPKIT